MRLDNHGQILPHVFIFCFWVVRNVIVFIEVKLEFFVEQMTFIEGEEKFDQNLPLQSVMHEHLNSWWLWEKMFYLEVELNIFLLLHFLQTNLDSLIFWSEANLQLDKFIQIFWYFCIIIGKSFCFRLESGPSKAILPYFSFCPF